MVTSTTTTTTTTTTTNNNNWTENIVFRLRLRILIMCFYLYTANNDVQYWNAPSPILATLFPSVTDVREEQCANA
jgi:hypothetical protein